MDLAQYPLARIADQVGTPFYLYDGALLRDKLAGLGALTEGTALRAATP